MVTNMIWQRPLKSMEAFFGLSVHSSPLICIERNARACAGAVDAAKGLTVDSLGPFKGLEWIQNVEWRGLVESKSLFPPRRIPPVFLKVVLNADDVDPQGVKRLPFGRKTLGNAFFMLAHLEDWWLWSQRPVTTREKRWNRTDSFDLCEMTAQHLTNLFFPPQTGLAGKSAAY